MPKLINSVPKLRRHATGQGFVTLNGINHYLGTWGTGKMPSRKVKDAYDAKIAEWLAQGRRPTTAAHAVTVGFLCLEFLKDAKKTYGDDPNSRYGKFATLVDRLRVYEALAVCEFGPIQLKAIRETMVREGLSITTVNQAIGNIRQIFKWGVAEGLLPVEIWHTLQCVSGLRRGYTTAKEPEPVEPVERSRVEATLPHLPPMVRAMVSLHMIIGCRPSEVCNLRIGDIDRTTLPWRVELKEHKTAKKGKQRIMFLGPKARAILEPIIRGRSASEYVFSPIMSERLRLAERASRRVCPLSQGNRPNYSAFSRSGAKKRSLPPREQYDRHSYRKAVQRACLKAFPAPEGLDEAAIKLWNDGHTWAPSQLRHTVATEARQHRGLELASLVLGHAEIETTQIYAEKNLALLSEFMELQG